MMGGWELAEILLSAQHFNKLDTVGGSERSLIMSLRRPPMGKPFSFFWKLLTTDGYCLTSPPSLSYWALSAMLSVPRGCFPPSIWFAPCKWQRAC